MDAGWFMGAGSQVAGKLAGSESRTAASPQLGRGRSKSYHCIDRLGPQRRVVCYSSAPTDWLRTQVHRYGQAEHVAAAHTRRCVGVTSMQPASGLFSAVGHASVPARRRTSKLRSPSLLTA